MTTGQQELFIHQAISGVIDREAGPRGSVMRANGGYVDRPEDRGGPTKWGVTLPTLSDYLGRKATLADLKALTENSARDLYRLLFVVRPGFLAIENPELFELVVDAGVHSHPRQATKMLQRALGLDDDGVLGPVTRAALAAAPIRVTYLRMVAERVRFLGRLISKDRRDADHDGVPDSTEFASGWLDRSAYFIERAPA